MISGYPSAPSVFPGETLTFHLSTDAPELRVDLYRCGAALELAARSAWIRGERFPPLGPGDDWSVMWRGHAFPLAADLRPGVYVAMFVEGDGHGRERASQRLDRTTADGRDGKALFVVRGRTPGARILYKVPLFTYVAYNEEGEPPGSLYTGEGRRVGLRRPGNGTGGRPWDAGVPDVYDLASPRQTFAHWDAKMIRWLEENGYAVDFATDLDVHEDEGELLSSYALLLSAGHDEYWSERMRDHVEAFVARGGNVAFFSANVAYWRVAVEDGGAALAIDKRVPEGEHAAYDLFSRTRPENALTGVAYGRAGGHWNGPRPSGGGYTVHRPEHWVFAGTGLAAGEVFGEAEALVGYECDGAAFTLDARGLPVPTGADGSPLDFEILATSPLAGWEDPQAGAASTATLGLYRRGGIVFTAATTDWVRVLAGGSAAVDRITRNVLDALAR